MRHVLLMTAMAVAVTAATPLSARDRDRDEVVRITPNQIVDMADARIAQLKADLRLTPDQDRNWGSFQNALHDMAQRRADRMTRVREARSAQTDPAAPAPITTAPAATAPVAATPVDPNARPLDDRDMRARSDRDDRDRAPDLVADMRTRADMMTARADDFRKFADAAGPLYNSLDDRQRQRFLAFVQMNMMDDPMMGPPARRGRDRDRDRW